MLVNFLLWVKWVLTNAKTVLSFIITLKSIKKSKEWEGPKETGRVGTEHPLAGTQRGSVAERGRSKHGRMLLAIFLHLILRETEG